MEDLKTIYEMKELVERCFKECEEAGHIQVKNRASTDISDVEKMHKTLEVYFVKERVIVNVSEIADHISKTIIGELLEFEILRKLSPLFRSLRSIENQMKFLDDKQAFQANLPGIRLGPK